MKVEQIENSIKIENDNFVVLISKKMILVESKKQSTFEITNDCVKTKFKNKNQILIDKDGLKVKKKEN